jgi:hypothetical protein
MLYIDSNSASYTLQPRRWGCMCLKTPKIMPTTTWLNIPRIGLFYSNFIMKFDTSYSYIILLFLCVYFFLVSLSQKLKCNIVGFIFGWVADWCQSAFTNTLYSTSSHWSFPSKTHRTTSISLQVYTLYYANTLVFSFKDTHCTISISLHGHIILCQYISSCLHTYMHTHHQSVFRDTHYTTSIHLARHTQNINTTSKTHI